MHAHTHNKVHFSFTHTKMNSFFLIQSEKKKKLYEEFKKVPILKEKFNLFLFQPEIMRR